MQRSSRLATKRKLNLEERPSKKPRIDTSDSESSHQMEETISLDIYHFCKLHLLLGSSDSRRECDLKCAFKEQRRDVPSSWSKRRIQRMVKEMVKEQVPTITKFSADYVILYGVHKAAYRESLTDIDHDTPLKELRIDFGMTIFVQVQHSHQIMKDLQRQHGVKHEPEINDCPLMRNGEKTCAVYDRLKNYEYSLEDLEHMERYSHCAIPPVVCRYGDRGEECKAYIRLNDGGNRLDDRCHLRLYQHPPRTVPKAMRSKCKEFQKGKKKYATIPVRYQLEDKQIEMLMEEVKRNGFESDLVTKEGECIMKIVNEKMHHPQHKALGCPLNKAQMLSIILYTGCECNRYLSEADRAGEWDKWPVFGRILTEAVTRLRYREYGEYPVYCGLRGVMDFGLEDGNSTLVHLRSFTSTSWDIAQAIDYCKGDGKEPEGMILGFTSEIRRFGANVSWISKFGDEKEILFMPMKVKMRLISQNKKVQKVVVFWAKEERVF